MLRCRIRTVKACAHDRPPPRRAGALRAGGDRAVRHDRAGGRDPLRRRPDHRGRRPAACLRPAPRARPRATRVRRRHLAPGRAHRRPVAGGDPPRHRGCATHRGVRPLGEGLPVDHPQLASIAARRDQRSVHLPPHRGDQPLPHLVDRQRRGGAPHRPAAGRARRALARRGRDARHRRARAGRRDAHPLPAQRTAPHDHAQVRRPGHRARRRGAHPRRVLQPDDRRRPAGGRDPGGRRTDHGGRRTRTRRGRLPRRRLRPRLRARPAVHQPARPR